MDKLQFKDMISHYDPNRDDPDGYLQYRAKRRKNGAMSEEKDKDVHEQLAWRERFRGGINLKTPIGLVIQKRIQIPPWLMPGASHDSHN